MRSITLCLDAWAVTQPEKLLFAFIDADGHEREAYTYRQFQMRTRGLADQLARSTGLARNDRVLLAYPPGLELIVAFFACARMGAIPVPTPAAMNNGRGLPKLLKVAEDCQARAVLASQDVLDSVSTVSAARNRDWIATEGLRELAGPEFRDDPNPILFLQYTSGSTGDPRGVIVTHENVLENAASTVSQAEIGVSWLPHYHDMGLIGYHLFVAISGGTGYDLSPRDFLRRPALWLQTISRVRATYASAPNFGFEYCLRPGKINSSDLIGVDLSCLQVLMSAAEPVQPRTVRRFIERFRPYGLKPEACVVAYGLAESTLAVAHYGRRFVTADPEKLRTGGASLAPLHDDDGNGVALASCGRALPGIEVLIVDPQTHTVLPEHRVGEIWIAGASVCRGYWGRPALTKDVFGNALADNPQGTPQYLRTGDLGFLDAGELFVCGRIKEIIICRGVNHYPGDIEAAVASASTKIRDGGVAAFSGNREETLVIVAEVKNPHDLPDPAKIAGAVTTQCQIEPFIIVLAPPRTIARTTSGKNARQVTREWFLSGQLSSVATYRAPPVRPDTFMMHNARERLQSLLASCGDLGGERTTLAAMGFDSVKLIDIFLDLEQLLSEFGIPDLANEIDVSLLQQLTTSDLSLLLERPDGSSVAAVEARREHLQRIRRAFEQGVQSQMRADATLRPGDLGTYEVCQEPIKQVLMTGVTGFFGPFLLSSLLSVTPYEYWVLVRANDSEHGRVRLQEALRRAGLWTRSLASQVESRVRVVCGDLSREWLGLQPQLWTSLTRSVHAVFHNAALVNYVLTYNALRLHNVEGTRALLKFASTARRKDFHFISSTFIFGWTRKRTLAEIDNNNEAEGLDFGYAQSKWVAEQLVLAAEARGLPVQIYRPSLISASSSGIGDCNDIAIRLLSFMINQGIAVETANQLSLIPADVAAANIL